MISIGGPEQSPAQTPPFSDEEEGSDSGSRVAQVPPAIQRQASEFTTDGRGRVISVGDPVTESSSGTDVSGSSLEMVLSPQSGSSDERVGPGQGRGFFAWFPFNSLF